MTKTHTLVGTGLDIILEYMDYLEISKMERLRAADMSGDQAGRIKCSGYIKVGFF